jgi:hypothetical protein
MKFKALSQKVLLCGLVAALVAVLSPMAVFAAEGGRGAQDPKVIPAENINTLAVPTVNDVISVDDLLSTLLGQNITVTDWAVGGFGGSRGVFSGAGDILGFDSGIVLTTGDVRDIFQTENFPSTPWGLPGDADLDLLTPLEETYDAIILELNFIPEYDTISFEYVFTTIEWDQGAEFSDVFGFYVNDVNYALTPGGLPISVENLLVESGIPTDTYEEPPTQGLLINTSTVDNFAFFARTVTLTCTAPVNPGVPNHMKIGLADSGDGIYDSVLFFRAQSFNSGAVVEPQPQPQPTPDPTPDPTPSPSPAPVVPQTGETLLPFVMLGIVAVGGASILALAVIRRKRHTAFHK